MTSLRARVLIAVVALSTACNARDSGPLAVEPIAAEETAPEQAPAPGEPNAKSRERQPPEPTSRAGSQPSPAAPTAAAPPRGLEPPPRAADPTPAIPVREPVLPAPAAPSAPAPPKAPAPPLDSPRASEPPTPPAAPRNPAAPAAPGARLSFGSGDLLLGDDEAQKIYSLAKDGSTSGLISSGRVRGLSVDRRRRDGVWVLAQYAPCPTLTKVDPSGRTLARVNLSGRAPCRARELRGLDFVFGHSPESDLLLVHYSNRRGVDVLEGFLARTGESRFIFCYDKNGDFDGVKAELYRHNALDGLLILEWWTLRRGGGLELWRYAHGFMDRLSTSPLPTGIAALDTFDLPPWREVIGADRRGARLVRFALEQTAGRTGKTAPAVKVRTTPSPARSLSAISLVP